MYIVILKKVRFVELINNLPSNFSFRIFLDRAYIII